ncbi:hypothetical protein OHM26_005478 [Escherichia coli]|nr:hypothetical protein [Escherichia coli]
MVISTVGYEKRTGSASSASIIIQKELQPDNAIIQGKAISSVGRNVEISTGKRGTDINTRRIPASNCLSARNAELKHDHTGAGILWSYAFSIVTTNRNKNLAGANIKRCDTV